MAQKVTDITNVSTRYDYLSQTPGNFSKDNYYLRELQEKVNAEWMYRPNRIDIEYEDNWGEQTYSPIEVVVQSVKSEKGEDISNDCRNIVFKDIAEDRFQIGSKFRMVKSFRDTSENKIKNIWLATNTNSVKMTSSMIIKRCTGTLGSLYKDARGVSRYHYEPVIIESDLTSVGLSFNQTAVSPTSALVVTAQHNDYTRNYFMNQRFIVGYDSVYRIKSINKFYGNTTFDAEDVGLIKIYLEVTEKSPYDDFNTRIAYQSTEETDYHIDGGDGEYSIEFTSPEKIPSFIGTEPVTFSAVLCDSKGEPVQGATPRFSYTMENLPATVSLSTYVSVQEQNGGYTITKKKTYLRGNLILTWVVPAQESPTKKDISVSMSLSLKQA